jgi:predicted RNA-binding protein with PUA-like domain
MTAVGRRSLPNSFSGSFFSGTIAMPHWLLKSEPETFSWDDLCRRGRDMWDGVRNHQAAQNLRAMQAGEWAFFYHSVREKRIVGIVEIVRTAYPDPTDPSGRFVVVDVVPVAPLPQPVTLQQIKEDPRLTHLALVRQSRLSVTPVDPEAWAVICGMGGMGGMAEPATRNTGQFFK